jgi:hypothetical protein
MKLNAYAAWPHYIDHIAPIWQELDGDVKGEFVVPSPPLLKKLESKGIEGTLTRHKGKLPRSMTNKEPVLVAGYADLRKQTDRPIAFLEHGAGQTYVLDDGTIHGGYSGGANRGNVDLFLCPNETVAQRNLQAYPEAQAAAIGCPKLDDLLAVKKAGKPSEATVAISFHWDCRVVQESGSAFTHFATQILDFAKWCQVCGIDVIGHAHPRAWKTLKGWWEQNFIEAVQEWEEVVKRADVLIIDNSSIMYEASALGMGVVVLESPSWRRNVNHGLRFWEFAGVGPAVRPNQSLVDAYNATRCNSWEKERKRIVGEVYAVAPSDARLSSKRAASVLTSWVTNGGTTTK